MSLVLVGCTASKATLQLVAAEQSLVRAESYEAPVKAEYEYTMALRYLEKAREEAGYSEFRIADALARKSAEWSDRAIIFVERRGKAELSVDDLPDLVREVPAPQPDITFDDPDDEDGPVEDDFELDDDIEIEQ